MSLVEQIIRGCSHSVEKELPDAEDRATVVEDQERRASRLAAYPRFCICEVPVRRRV